MKARGKCEAKRARRPWISKLKEALRPEGPKYAHSYSALSGLGFIFVLLPGATCSLRSHLPLAIIFRAFGALGPELRACSACHSTRLRRFGSHADKSGFTVSPAHLYFTFSAARKSLLHSSSSTPPTTVHSRNVANRASASARMSMAHQFNDFKNGMDDP